MFALTLLVLLLASINYQLNLGYVLTFLLAGSGVVSMHITHGTLRGLTLHLRPVAPAFAGDPAVLDIVHDEPGAGALRHRPARARRADADAGLDRRARPAARRRAHVSFVPAARGLHDVPTLSAETRFPLGLFRAWTVWRPAARLLVYPQLEADAPRAAGGAAGAGGPTPARGAAKAARSRACAPTGAAIR